jgi:hydroxymethylpyrimidine/phosphomethylpyrimidine kinase
LILIAITIAGSDPSGGAGLQADLKTFHQFGVYGTSVVTLITVQNTISATRVETLDPVLVGEQFDAILNDLPPQAIKTGALGTASIIEAIAARKFEAPLVIDPVMIGKHGGKLLDTDAHSALRKLLIPRATLITPNLDEATELAGMEVHDPESMKEAAKRIAGLGARSVLIKGGHLEGDAIDLLWHENTFIEYRKPRLNTKHTHGTGCTYSAAITACLAKGDTVPEAVAKAKTFIHEAIRTAPGLGAGNGPLNLMADTE